MTKNYLKIWYILFDVVGSAAAWTLFCIYPAKDVGLEFLRAGATFEFDGKFYASLVFFVLFWLALFIVAGFYNNLYRKSRLKEFTKSVGYTFVGTVVIFFILLLDDSLATYNDNFSIIGSMFILELTFTYFPRLVLTTGTIRKIHRRIIGFPTIIVGNGFKALQVYRELEAEKKSQGFRFVGYIAQVNNHEDMLQSQQKRLGEMDSIAEVVKKQGVEEVILAVEGEDVSTLTRCINELLPLKVNLRAIPSMYDFLLGRVKMTGILNAPLISVSFDLMPLWQANIKRIADYTVSALAIVLLLPVSLILGIAIRCTSQGPIIFKQERIGQYGRPFWIYKFRSMYADAEKSGPTLSGKDDPRVTPIGRFMRKTKLDEIPNFINVLKGEMSLVGPRPERQCYIEQIVRIAPHYVHLQKVKPGITSWGQVKFGYAKNVDEMVERLKYDILYLENMSLFVDLKIIIYTILTIFKGKGL
ncbi:MAG: sugar transferase [Bacteroidales bacterium]|nr:sugar transferase [Bacteroidales bacterium]HNT41646.1 sugar transferase [Tenuifilaceae bacterium]MBP8644388.1 sugar transferase [Bacteroidales bacterium]NLI87860.1 sugar transferase [Bacteroidales bacterium]HOA09597.1 sugar transferase [Tenuifilaceae bacterium]